jgi:hypothetical protein
MKPAMLGELQRALEVIYGLDAAQSVEEFLVTPAMLLRLGTPVRAPEALLILPGPEQVELALYLSPDVLARLPELAQDGPCSFLEQLLPTFATAAEGVSHFVYLCWQALRDRAVSLLELEAQAEIDKFATGVLHLWRHGERRRSTELRERLFDRVGYRIDLSPEERDRYGFANQLARGYCAFLESHYVLGGCLESLLADLRRSWRLPGPDKFAYLLQRA